MHNGKVNTTGIHTLSGIRNRDFGEQAATETE